jgi:hypothetical protein
VDKESDGSKCRGLAAGNRVPREGGQPREDPFKRVVELAQLMEGFELEPSEADLKSTSKEFSGCKPKIQSLTRPILALDNPALAADAHEVWKADEIMARGQKHIRRLLQRLGVLREGSETSSLENVATRASKPLPKPSGAPEEFFLSGGDPDKTMGDKVKWGLRQGRG